MAPIRPLLRPSHHLTPLLKPPTIPTRSLRLPPSHLRPLHALQRHHQKPPSSTSHPPTHHSTSPPPPRPYTFEETASLASHPTPTRILIDLREPAELAQTGRIPGAYSLPLTSNPDAFYLDDDAFLERFGWERPREGEVVFYCRAGVRSGAAARLAGEWGGIRVGDMTGGWLEWEGRGGAVER